MIELVVLQIFFFYILIFNLKDVMMYALLENIMIASISVKIVQDIVQILQIVRFVIQMHAK